MELYHFTSPVHLDGCLKEGITKGMIPLLENGQVTVISGWQWLTSNPKFNQSWAEFSSLPYDRTAYRLTVNIPKSAMGNLSKWLDICKTMPFLPDLNTYGDPENWWVLKRRIKPGWIRGVEKKKSCPLCGQPMKLKEKTDVGDYYECKSCRFTVNVDAYGGQPTYLDIAYPECEKGRVK